MAGYPFGLSLAFWSPGMTCHLGSRAGRACHLGAKGLSLSSQYCTMRVKQYRANEMGVVMRGCKTLFVLIRENYNTILNASKQILLNCCRTKYLQNGKRLRLVFFKCGPRVVGSWSSRGRIVVQTWSDRGPSVVGSWSKRGRIVVSRTQLSKFCCCT